MTTLNGIFNIGRSGLLAHQRAIHVTGNNISNANTKGYSRQRVSFETAPTITTSIGSTGTGVMADIVQRIVDNYIEPQIRSAITDAGSWEAQKDALEKADRPERGRRGVGPERGPG
jgi:flagellar hook-associated protein 1 FlgK